VFGSLFCSTYSLIEFPSLLTGSLLLLWFVWIVLFSIQVAAASGCKGLLQVAASGCS
jgi:hypothetical protein